MTAEIPPNILSKLASEVAMPESAVYSLRMFWLGRFDKLNVGVLPVYDWLTKAYMPKSLSEGYAGGAPNVVLFPGEDHSTWAQRERPITSKSDYYSSRI